MFSLRSALALSLFAHLAVYLFFITTKSVPKNRPEIISIEFQKTSEPALLKTKLSKATAVKSKVVHSTNLKSINLKPIFSHTDHSEPADPSEINVQDERYASSPLIDNVKMAWGAGGGTFDRVKNYLLYKKIYDSIDSTLYFPSFFIRQNIQGGVNARLVLNETGTCNWHQTQIHNSNFYIQLYVLSVLKKACMQNFKPFLNGREVSVVDLSFLFQFGEMDNPEKDSANKFIVGNTLQFYRSQVKSIMEWEFGPFKGIFPLPAVYLDIPWIQENWDTIVNSKDPKSIFKKEFGG